MICDNSWTCVKHCRVDKSGIQRPSATVTGRLEQAKRWLQQPAIDDMGLGQVWLPSPFVYFEIGW